MVYYHELNKAYRIFIIERETGAIISRLYFCKPSEIDDKANKFIAEQKRSAKLKNFNCTYRFSHVRFATVDELTTHFGRMVKNNVMSIEDAKRRIETFSAANRVN